MEKTCFKCGETKAIESFHKHSRMKDGRLNKCAACVVKDVAAWRSRNPSARDGEYEKALARGKRTRQRTQAEISEAATPERKLQTRRAVSAKHIHKKMAKDAAFDDELTDLVAGEAARLVQLRNAATGIKWSIDHIVPRNHQLACGLHIWSNLQVVPFAWNMSKGRATMDTFFPV